MQPQAALALALCLCSSTGEMHLCNGTTNAIHRCCPHLHLTSVFSIGTKHLYAEPCSPGLICVSFQNKFFHLVAAVYYVLMVCQFIKWQKLSPASQIVPLHAEVVNAGGQKWNGSRNVILLLYSARMALSPLCTYVALVGGCFPLPIQGGCCLAS